MNKTVLQTGWKKNSIRVNLVRTGSIWQKGRVANFKTKYFFYFVELWYKSNNAQKVMFYITAVAVAFEKSAKLCRFLIGQY